jgi:hypothetical protein
MYRVLITTSQTSVDATRARAARSRTCLRRARILSCASRDPPRFAHLEGPKSNGQTLIMKIKTLSTSDFPEDYLSLLS